VYGTLNVQMERLSSIVGFMPRSAEHHRGDIVVPTESDHNHESNLLLPFDELFLL
jgi:hypothetical protein